MSAGDGSSSSSHGELLRTFAAAPPIEPPPALPSIGDRIGRFVIGERLGSGASGVVFAARDDVLDRDVALKILALGRAASRPRILREARAAAKLVHPGVALVHDVLEREEGLALVLERVHGRTLREILRDGPLDESRAVRIVAQAARAVHAAHELGVIHRDLKPENIMLTAGDRVKLLDFGLATPNGAASGGPAGTVGYLAPEARRGDVGPTSDLYALAVVLVELVTGARSKDVHGLSRALGPIVARALATPADRFATGLAFAEALEGLAGMGLRTPLRSRLGLAGVMLLALSSLSWPGDATDGERPVVAVPPPAVSVRRVACPPLEAAARDRWLGAATANLACRAVRSRLGGSRAVAIPPAELLALPGTPSESFARDAFQSEGSRGLAIERAKGFGEDGLVWIDGSVERAGASFVVRLSLVQRVDEGGRAAGREAAVIASSVAEGPLAVATYAAARGLFEDESRAVLAPSPPDEGEPALAPELAEAIEFGHAAIDTGGSFEEARAHLMDFQDGDLGAAALVDQLSSILGREGDGGTTRAMPPPAVDRSSDASFVLTAPLHVVLGGDAAASELAREAATRREQSEGRARLMLVRAEAVLRLLAEERDLARSLALGAAEADPWDAPWSILAHASFGRPEWKTLSRAHTAWLPESADAWNIAAHVDAASPAERGEMLERAFILGDEFPLYAGNYATWLLSAGRLDEARAIVARLRLGSRAQRAAAVRLSLELAWAEGRLVGGFEDARRALAELPTIGSIETGDIAVVANAVELGVLLGRGEELADELARTFVDVEPPRLDRGPFARQAVAHVCAHASKAVAKRCFARLRAFETRGFFPMRDTGEPARFIEGAEAFSEGRTEDAARAFRAVQADLNLHAGLASRTFAARGDFQRANAVDPVRPGSREGLSLSHVRAALRSAMQRDCATLQDLAPKLARAFDRIDGDLPALAVIARASSLCPR